MIVCGYSLDLYCEHQTNYQTHVYSEFPHTFTGRSWSDTSRDARRAGWHLSKDRGVALCPKCVRAGLKLQQVK